MTQVALDGQVAIVTGAGRGIGRAEALDLAARGAAVVVNDVGREDADAVVEEIHSRGGRAAPSYDSVATEAGGEAIVQTAVEAFDDLHILVNNAGFLRCGYFEDLSFDAIDAILDVHLRAAFFVTQPSWRILKANGYGRIVNTSSSSGMFSHHGLSNYAAAKAGIYGLTKALAFEGQPRGIHVNALLPYAQTTISAEDPIPDMEEQRRRYYSLEDAGKLAARYGTDMISPLVTYLASPECTTTGEAFSACAGRYARVFVGVGDGWLSPASNGVSAEDIAEHFDDIRDIASHSVPKWLFEEVRDVIARLP